MVVITLCDFKNYYESGDLSFPFRLRIQLETDEVDDLLSFLIENHITKSSIVIDDCQSIFDGKMTKIQQKFVLTPKNNDCDIFLQFHSFRATPLKLLQGFDVMILKQISDSVDMIKRLPELEVVEILYNELRAENAKNDNLYACRVLNYSNNEIVDFKSNSATKFHKFLDEHNKRESDRKKLLKRLNQPRHY